MILLGSSLLDTPVMSIQTGAEIARTEQLVIDPADLAIKAFELHGHTLGDATYLRVDDVRELSDLGLIVDSSDELVALDDIIKLKELHDLHFRLDDMVVRDTSGRKLGKVADYTFETNGFIIQQLTVRRPLLRSLNDTELLIHRSQIIEINNDAIVVQAEAKVPEPKRSEVSGSYVNPFRTTKPSESIDVTSER